tara:strand:+ start:153 stop:389 length:237 start_codon:yes stop_codon:yes gene_type:complete
MTDYQRLIGKMQEGSKLIKSGKWSVKDYYLDLADFFDSLEPSRGVDIVMHRGHKHGGAFNFTDDAEDLRRLAKNYGSK